MVLLGVADEIVTHLQTAGWSLVLGSAWNKGSCKGTLHPVEMAIPGHGTQTSQVPIFWKQSKCIRISCGSRCC